MSLGYDSPFVKKTVVGLLRALETLSILSFDLRAWFWIHGLRNYLQDKVKEAEDEARD